MKRLFVEAHEAFGRLDILVNNAGVYQFNALEDVTEAEFHRQFDTNVLGPILGGLIANARIASGCCVQGHPRRVGIQRHTGA